MWNHLFDVLAVGTDQSSQGDVLIQNLDMTAFPEQPFDQLYLRALTQIVGARFETQPQHGDPTFAAVLHQFLGAVQMGLIAGKDRLKQRKLQVEFFGAVVQSANILGEAGSAKSETWLQIGSGNVELVVGKKNLSCLLRVHP